MDEAKLKNNSSLAFHSCCTAVYQIANKAIDNAKSVESYNRFQPHFITKAGFKEMLN
jgi:hypothetical protein